MRPFFFTLIAVLLGGPALATPPFPVDTLFEKAVSLYNEKAYVESMEAFREYQEASIAEKDTSRLPYALSYIYQGDIAFLKLGERGRSLAPLNRAFRLCEQFDHQTTKLAVAGSCLGYHYGVIATDFDKAQRIFQSAILRFPADSTPDYFLLYCYSQLGNVYSRKGDYEQAISYYQRGMNIREPYRDKPKLFSMGLRVNLADNFRLMGRSEEAKAVYFEMLQDTLVDIFDKNWVKMALATVYMADSMFSEARNLTLEALHYALQHSDMKNSGRLVAKCYAKLGDIAFAEGDFRRSIQYHRKTIRLFESPDVFGPNNRATAQIMFRVACAHRDLGENAKALDMFQQALAVFVPYFSPRDPYELPVVKERDREVWVISCLREKARLLLVKQAHTREQKWAKMALDHVNLAIKQQEKVVYSLGHRENNTRLIEEDYAIYLYGLEACHILFKDTKEGEYLEQAFQIMEQGKAMLLHKNAHLGDLSGSAEMRTRIDSLQSRIIQLRIKAKEESGAGKARELLDQLEVEVDLLRAQSMDDPALNQFFLRQNAPLILKHLQQTYLENSDRGLIHFFVTQDAKRNIFILFVGKQDISFQKILLDDSLASALEGYRNVVSHAPSTLNADSAFINFRKNAYQLYQKLLQPVLESHPDIHHLTIIPHGFLNSIPFESMLTDPADEVTSYRNLPYLVRSMSVSYAYSATSLVRDSNTRIERGALAIAPAFSQKPTQREDSVRDNLTRLAWTSEEAKRVYSLYGGKIIRGDKASEAIFKKQYRNHGIVHIASHALLHEIEPGLSRIMFSESRDPEHDGSLFLEEILSMDFRNKLVCLSACNTAWGKLTRSNGLLSLARGFHYAGSPSLMGTLWQAHDRSSFLLSTGFHQQLTEGKSLDAAMQHAKTSYLEHADALKAHPYYWAHMIVLGETDLEIPKRSKSGFLPVLVFLALFGVALYAIRPGGS